MRLGHPGNRHPDLTQLTRSLLFVFFPMAATRGEPDPTSSLGLDECVCSGFKAVRFMPDSECLAFGGVVNFTCGVVR